MMSGFNFIFIFVKSGAQRETERERERERERDSKTGYHEFLLIMIKTKNHWNFQDTSF